MTETTTPVMATTAPITVPMIHLVSLLTSESYHGRTKLYTRSPSV